MTTKRIDIMIEEEKKNLGDKIKRAQDAATIKEIRTACRDMIYNEGDVAERGLALLTGIITIFPSKLFKEIPELKEVCQKLENGEVEIKRIERSKQIIKRANAYDNGYANGLKDGNITVSRFTYEEDIKAEFEASPKILLEIEQFSDNQMENIVKEVGVLQRASYWVALREAVEKELCKR